MITPKFTIRQDENRVYIDIKTAHIRAAGGELEFQVEGDLFVFSLVPYYLRLRFPGRLLNDEDEKVQEDETLKSTTSYDAANCVINISICKEVPGEDFPDLDLISKLLARSKNLEHSGNTIAGGPEEGSAQLKQSLIQEMDLPSIGDGSTDRDVDAHFAKLQSEAEEFDWEIPQEDPGRLNDDDDVNMSASACYGFNRQHSGEIGVSLASGGNDANEVPEPEKSVPGGRAAFREQLELMAFDQDYYLADTFDNPEIPEFIHWESPDTRDFKKAFSAGGKGLLTQFEFTSEEQDAMQKLPKRTYILDNPRRTYIGLIGVLFATCYDIRTTQGDSTVESAWTICKLCPLFAALDDSFNTTTEIVKSCLARAISFPLYRNWDLAVAVMEDVYKVLRLGKRRVLRLLLKAKSILDVSDPYYIYSRIWVDDYATWIQYANDEVLRGLSHELHKVKLDKNLVELELDELEDAAREAISEQQAEQ